MSVYILYDKCDGCMGLREPMCVKVCPGDILCVDSRKKIVVRAQEECWDCFSCVKACPQKALCVKLPHHISNFSALQLETTVWRDTTIWVFRSPDGEEERFEIFSLKPGRVITVRGKEEGDEYYTNGD